MAISKRLRFEILRRDKFKCQYCGLTAQETELHIDHVRPKSLGGDDGPDNLVAACKDCNAGKSSISLDEPTVAQIAEDNAQAALDAQIRSAKMRGKLEELTRELDEFEYTWESMAQECGRPLDLPIGWRPSVINWINMGVPRKEFEYAIETAMTRERVRDGEVFRYLAGIIWGRIRDEEITLEDRAEPRLWTDDDRDEYGAYSYSEGKVAGENKMWRNPWGILWGYDIVAHVVDNWGPKATKDLIWKEREHA